MGAGADCRNHPVGGGDRLDGRVSQEDRDSTPEEYLVTFKNEIYHGTVETHGDEHANGLARLREVMKQAATLQPSGVLGKYAGPQVKQGTCHQFANEGRLPWHR